MFTQRSKGAALLMSLILIFIFTVTTNVVFESAPAWAETSEATEEATDEASGSADSEGGFFSGIINWINSVTNAVNKMWGMENGSGVAMVVNAAFYLILIVGTLFLGKTVFNIVNDLVNRKVDQKYEKPSFRKK